MIEEGENVGASVVGVYSLQVVLVMCVVMCHTVIGEMEGLKLVRCHRGVEDSKSRIIQLVCITWW